MDIRKIAIHEIEPALALAWEVFLEYEAPDYSEQGVQEFYNSIHDSKYQSMLQVYGAYIEEQLVGMIATHSRGQHLALFFVKGKYLKQGIGRKLFNEALKESNGIVTVNSSPFAIPIYHSLGFQDADTEQIENGLRYTPMKIQL